MTKPVRIGITLGDINGIGPEVALKAVYKHPWPASAQFVFIGATEAFKKISRHVKTPFPKNWNVVLDEPPKGKQLLWDPTPGLALKWKPGKLDPTNSQAAAIWIRSAVYACMKKKLDAIVTAPISKEGFHAAGIHIPGHTEFLAELTGTHNFAMMLFGGPLRVVLATRHIPLYKVSSALSADSLTRTLQLTAQALPWLGCKKKKIGVCGLNPHAGEGGTIGWEDQKIIEPAVKHFRHKGVNVEGPIPADTIFHRAFHGEFDAVVAMYHDQGLAPLKMIAFDEGVNVTLGLPLVRTSPDHGTAFDIAGKRKAKESSMVEAIRCAHQLAQRRNPWKNQTAGS